MADHVLNLRRVKCPPSDHRPYRRIVTAPEGSGGQFVALHACIEAFEMHWLNGRSFPCRGPANECEGCKGGFNSRWEGYIGVMGVRGGDQFILKVTAGAYRNSPLLASLDMATGLRGKLLVCTRIGKGRQRNGPARVEVREITLGREIPPPFDLLGALCRQWGLADLRYLNN